MFSFENLSRKKLKPWRDEYVFVNWFIAIAGISLSMCLLKLLLVYEKCIYYRASCNYLGDSSFIILYFLIRTFQEHSV